MFSLQTQRALRRAAASPAHVCATCRRFDSSASSPEPSKVGKPKDNTPQRIIFSGIQPTGVPHLGNYLGALRQWVKLQDTANKNDRLLFSIVDLHAITASQNPQQLNQWRKEMFASLMAVGLDPERSVLFAQADVPGHTELMWILSCNASMGYLGRMTQWKSKLQLQEDASPLDPSPSNKAALKLGLFSYPVLQAADILLYGTTHVPVGEDQAQHIEFTRELAAGFNDTFAKGKRRIFKVPETILSPAKRVMSLTNPAKKMSKSDQNPKSRILITDSKEDIDKKLRSALTDSVGNISYDPVERPGVSNLIDIMYHLNEDAFTSPEQLANELFGADVSMRALKEKVAETVEAHIRPVRERYEEIIGNEKYIEQVMRDGARKAKQPAGRTMATIRTAMGFRVKHDTRNQSVGETAEASLM